MAPVGKHAAHKLTQAGQHTGHTNCTMLRPCAVSMLVQCSPVCMNHCLRKGVTEGLQEVRAEPTASAARNCVREDKALQAVAVARLPLCEPSHDISREYDGW